ncbi:MAG TPA: hypothetical protein VLJ60_04835 [bacterium]|nr:hypothetical protein [bacterium]
MPERKKRNTAPVVIGDDFHKAMRLYFKKAGVPKRYQVEFALKEYYKEKAPEIFMYINEKTNSNGGTK